MLRNKILQKILWGMVAVLLIIPLYPPVSLAQAKLCCKKFCPHKSHAAGLQHQKIKKQCDASEGHKDCCQNGCTQSFGRDDAEVFTAVSVRTPQDTMTPADAATLLDESPEFPGGLLRPFPGPFPADRASPPLFITHSILRI